MTNSRRSGRDEKLLADAVRIETARAGAGPVDRIGSARDRARISHRTGQTASQRPQTASKGHRLRDRAGSGRDAVLVACEWCNSSGQHRGRACPVCEGKGQKRRPLLPISEADWSAQVEGLLDLFGWRWVHFRPGLTRSGRWATALSGCPGFPDYVAVKGDRLLVFELKSERGQATETQASWLYDLGKAGAGGYIFRPSDFGWLRAILAGEISY